MFDLSAFLATFDPFRSTFFTPDLLLFLASFLCSQKSLLGRFSWEEHSFSSELPFQNLFQISATLLEIYLVGFARLNWSRFRYFVPVALLSLFRKKSIFVTINHARSLSAMNVYSLSGELVFHFEGQLLFLDHLNPHCPTLFSSVVAFPQISTN